MRFFKVYSVYCCLFLGCASVNRNFWGGDPEYLKEKNDYFNWKLISSTMGLITKTTYV